MEKLEHEIIYCALSLFNKYGIRSVTMDDVARELGISKKTIYKYFENKADLVHKSVRTIYDSLQKHLLEINKTTKNAIDELMMIDQVVGEVLENHNPSLRFQLQKYYPHTYNSLYEGRHNLIEEVISSNVEKGKKAGLYRNEASTDIMTYLYCSKMHTLPEEELELLEKHSIKAMMSQAMEYHIRGMATEKGLEYLESKLKDKKKA